MGMRNMNKLPSGRKYERIDRCITGVTMVLVQVFKHPSSFLPYDPHICTDSFCQDAPLLHSRFLAKPYSTFISQLSV